MTDSDPAAVLNAGWLSKQTLFYLIQILILYSTAGLCVYQILFRQGGSEDDKRVWEQLSGLVCRLSAALPNIPGTKPHNE